MKRFVPLVMIAVMAAAAAHAQPGSGGGRRGRSQPQPAGAPASQPPDDAGSKPKPKAPDAIEIVGVITAIDPGADRVTIAYQAVDALTLPEGTRPFVVAKSALLAGRSVGERVRFTLESQQIATLRPFATAEAADAAPDPVSRSVSGPGFAKR